MFIELIDLLRCPVDHEDSWLVGAFTTMDGRFIVEGKLGCPVCSATYPIESGVAIFANAPRSPDRSPGTPEEIVRAAALLGLTRPGALVILDGQAAPLGQGIAEIAECRVIAINAHDTVEESERVGLIVSAARIPVAAGSVDGIVLTNDADGFAEASRVLRSGGRIVAPAHSEPGPAFREIARDERNVVAELVGPLVTLGAKAPRR